MDGCQNRPAPFAKRSQINTGGIASIDANGGGPVLAPVLEPFSVPVRTLDAMPGFEFLSSGIAGIEFTNGEAIGLRRAPSHQGESRSTEAEK